MQSQSKTANAIRQALTTKSGNSYIRSILQLAGAQRKVTDLKHNVNVYGGRDLVLTSWEKYFQSTREWSLGSRNGVFRGIRLPAGDCFDELVTVLPSYGLRATIGNELYQGGIEVMVDLHEAHMKKLVDDVELRQFVTTII